MEDKYELSGLYVSITALLVQEGAVVGRNGNGLSSTQIAAKLRLVMPKKIAVFSLEEAVGICLQTLVEEGEADYSKINNIKYYTLN